MRWYPVDISAKKTKLDEYASIACETVLGGYYEE